ncbi:hypothetical protein ACH4RG_23265 [Streptomyces sp. NPDC021019]|uniref:hypothetical protein n=1 Tax=Streptomyces sp. NPDC021019 TaxID=3365108 RepID=UPI0037A88D23
MDDPTPQHRIPGVRYTTETRYRAVTADVFGEETTEYEPYTVDVPVPPRDWDMVLFRFVLSVALMATIVAIVWSTAAIGSLLEKIATPGIAYAAASTFELLWILSLAAERLLRRTPDRVRRARIAGWVGLLIVTGAVIVHGVNEDQVAAGILGGVVSFLAKGAWWVVFSVKQVRLRPRLEQWLARRVEETAAEEYVLDARQQLGGRAAYNAAIYGAAEAQTARAAVVAARDIEPPAQAVTAAPAAPAVAPAAPPAHIPQPVAQAAPPAYVAPPVAPVAPPARPVTATPVPEAPVPSAPPVEPTPQPEPTPTPQPQVVFPMGPSIAATVRDALNEDEDISDEDLVAKVAAVHGDRPKLAETVATYRRKEMKKRKAS